MCGPRAFSSLTRRYDLTSHSADPTPDSLSASSNVMAWPLCNMACRGMQAVLQKWNLRVQTRPHADTKLAASYNKRSKYMTAMPGQQRAWPTGAQDYCRPVPPAPLSRLGLGLGQAQRYERGCHVLQRLPHRCDSQAQLPLHPAVVDGRLRLARLPVLECILREPLLRGSWRRTRG